MFALWREIGQQVLTIYPSKTASYAHRDVSSNISRDRKDDNDDVGNDDSGDDGGGGDMATATHFHQQYRHGGGNLWCSTSGLGVYWLHIRLDQYPKYYTYRPYKQVKEW